MKTFVYNRDYDKGVTEYPWRFFFSFCRPDVYMGRKERDTPE